MQAAGDEFEQVSTRLCDELGVDLMTARLDGKVPPGRSTEEWARTERYQCLAETALARRLGAVLLGQHADDQAETVILALSRGAGLPGLAAMPASFERHGMRFFRPWLTLEKQAFKAHLDQWGVSYAQDPANDDERLVRSRIRSRLAPALNETFPGYKAMFARSARHAAQAAALHDEVGKEDLARLGVPPRIEGLQAMSAPRLANALRHWLKSVHHTQATSAQLDELMAQIRVCRTRGHEISIRVGAGRVVRVGEVLEYRETL
ncbi:tRNA lysidine(34) synthetase TilS [Hydrogenophaga sp. 5NK40-0174]